MLAENWFYQTSQKLKNSYSLHKYIFQKGSGTA